MAQFRRWTIDLKAHPDHSNNLHRGPIAFGELNEKVGSGGETPMPFPFRRQGRALKVIDPY